MTSSSRLVLGVYAAVAAIQLLTLALGNQLAANTMKFFLLPLLIVFVLVSVGWKSDASTKWLVIGQFFAWLGDIALMSDAQLLFFVGIAMFLVMQICYIVGFFKLGAREGVRRRKWVLIAYPVFWVVANAALWPGLGVMRVPIAIYSAALVTMALCSVGTGTMLGIGGTLFMLSDLTIGATVAYGNFFGSAVFIMLTYIVGQLLIAIAWTNQIRSRAPAEVGV